MQATYTEPCMMHAALAIAALSRNHYLPNEPKATKYPVQSVGGYAIQQYNLAIHKLNNRLDTSPQSRELAILGSIVFIVIESLEGDIGRLQMHLQSALAIFHENSDVGRLDLESCVTGTTFQTPVKSTPNLNYLVDALSHINRQVSAFTSFN